jgi:phosphoglycolate phosphatase
MDTGHDAQGGREKAGAGLVSLQAVIFDFDFTLVDSSRGFVECHGYACEALSLPTIADVQAMAMMGTPLHDAFRLLFDEEHHALAEDYVRLWQERADEVMTDLTEVYGDVERTVDELRAMGLKTGIVSQKLRHRLEAVLHREGLTGRFDVVLGGGDIANMKPHPEGLLKALDAIGVSPGSAVYVGDTVIDAGAAANAGVPFIAVLTGVTPASAFTALAPVAVLNDVSMLPGTCRSLS